MPGIVYAQPSDLTAWDANLTQPTDVARYLRTASNMVAAAINENVYDPSALVTAPKTDATCAQVAAWITSGIDPSSGGILANAVVSQKGVDGATISYDTAGQIQIRADLAKGLCPESLAILNAAQLLWNGGLPIWSSDPDQGVYVNEFGTVSGS